jgi:hypothetical protein
MFLLLLELSPPTIETIANFNITTCSDYYVVVPYAHDGYIPLRDRAFSWDVALETPIMEEPLLAPVTEKKSQEKPKLVLKTTKKANQSKSSQDSSAKTSLEAKDFDDEKFLDADSDIFGDSLLGGEGLGMKIKLDSGGNELLGEATPSGKSKRKSTAKQDKLKTPDMKPEKASKSSKKVANPVSSTSTTASTSSATTGATTVTSISNNAVVPISTNIVTSGVTSGTLGTTMSLPVNSTGGTVLANGIIVTPVNISSNTGNSNNINLSTINSSNIGSDSNRPEPVDMMTLQQSSAVLGSHPGSSSSGSGSNSNPLMQYPSMSGNTANYLQGSQSLQSLHQYHPNNTGMHSMMQQKPGELMINNSSSSVNNSNSSGGPVMLANGIKVEPVLLNGSSSSSVPVTPSGVHPNHISSHMSQYNSSTLNGVNSSGNANGTGPGNSLLHHHHHHHQQHHLQQHHQHHQHQQHLHQQQQSMHYHPGMYKPPTSVPPTLMKSSLTSLMNTYTTGSTSGTGGAAGGLMSSSPATIPSVMSNSSQHYHHLQHGQSSMSVDDMYRNNPNNATGGMMGSHHLHHPHHHYMTANGVTSGQMLSGLHPNATGIGMNMGLNMNLTGSNDSERRVGQYTIEERRIKIEKFRERKRQRIWRKQIKYDCRKRLADNRPRVKGRFVSRKNLGSNTAPDTPGDDNSSGSGVGGSCNGSGKLYHHHNLHGDMGGKGMTTLEYLNQYGHNGSHNSSFHPMLQHYPGNQHHRPVAHHSSSAGSGDNHLHGGVLFIGEGVVVGSDNDDDNDSDVESANATMILGDNDMDIPPAMKRSKTCEF